MMKLGLQLLAPFLVCAVVLAPAESNAGIEFSAHEIKTLTNGGLVIHPLPGSGENSVVAGTSFVLIDAPPEVVWRAIQDVPVWTHIFPNTSSSKVMAVSGGTKAVKMRVGNAIIKVGFYLTAVFDQEKMNFTFSLNKKKPHDIDEARGWMRLLPQPGGKTLVVFSALVRTPFGLLIKLMGNKVIGWIEHRMLIAPKRLKEWVEGPNGVKYRSYP